jgi:hypothetical protein
MLRVADPQTKRMLHAGGFASEEDAARAYDGATVQAYGPGAKRNFSAMMHKDVRLLLAHPSAGPAAMVALRRVAVEPQPY